MSAGIFNLEAEQALLGAILFNNDIMDAAGALRSDHFYDPTHGRIYEACVALRRDGRAFDGRVLKARFEGDGGLREIGGADYLMTLMERAAPLTALAASYATMIADLAHRRALAEAAMEALHAAESPPEGADGANIQWALESRLQEISAGSPSGEAWETLERVVGESVAKAEAGEARGMSTGIAALDEITGGLPPGAITFIGGATSGGKSLLGGAISRNIAASGLGMAEIHLEMSRTQIGLRNACALAFEANPKLAYDNPHYLSAMRGVLRPAQWERLKAGAAKAAGLPIWIDARPGRSLAQIEAAVRRRFAAFRREGVTPGAVLIDHEGLIAPERGARHPSQLERTNARAEGLLAMAKRLGTHIIALCQLTKEGKRADGDERLPTTDDLKFGGALAEAADNVILIHRAAYHAERKPKHLRTEDDAAALRSRDCTLIVDKARSGMRGQINILMDVPSGAVFEPGEALS